MYLKPVSSNVSRFCSVCYKEKIWRFLSALVLHPPNVADITTLDPNSCWVMEIFHKISATVTKQKKKWSLGLQAWRKAKRNMKCEGHFHQSF